MSHWRQKTEILFTLKVCPTISLGRWRLLMELEYGKDNFDLKNAFEDLVKKGYKRSEILVTVRKDFPQYPWACVEILDCRLRHFSINYTKYDTPLETAQGAIVQELE